MAKSKKRKAKSRKTHARASMPKDIVEDMDSMLQSKISFIESKGGKSSRRHYETDKLMDGGKSVTEAHSEYQTLSSSVAVPNMSMELGSVGKHQRRHQLINKARMHKPIVSPSRLEM